MSQDIAMNRPELIQVVDNVARDKAIEREEVFIIMEQAIQKAGRSKYGQEKDIRASIDRKTGEIRLARYLEVVDDSGIIEDENGSEIGEHKGLAFYTLGQRQGLGIGGLRHAKNNPWYDISRVGIHGGSAGGQSSTGALLFHPGFYKVAVSSCGCHDNRMDKASWNEQWMGYPVGPQYSASSNIDKI